MFGFFWRVRNSEKYIKYLLGRRRELIDEKVALIMVNAALEFKIAELKAENDELDEALHF